VIISEFDSKEELIQVLLASCYIPFYAGLKFPQFKGQVSYSNFKAYFDHPPICSVQNSYTRLIGIIILISLIIYKFNNL